MNNEVINHKMKAGDISIIDQLAYTIKGAACKEKLLMNNEKKCAEFLVEFLFEKINITWALLNRKSKFDYRNNSGKKYIRIDPIDFIEYINEKAGSIIENKQGLHIIEKAVGYLDEYYEKYKDDTSRALIKVLDEEGDILISIHLDNFNTIPDLPHTYTNLNVNAFENYVLGGEEKSQL